MTGQASESTRQSDPTARLKALVADTNVNDDTFLATDYLNHFNEIVMLLEMIPDMPDILEDAREWQPKTYDQHFNDSGLSDSHITIEAYENAPKEFREPFDKTIERMNKVVASSLKRIEAAMDSPQPEELIAATAAASRQLQRLIDIAAAIIHGDTPNLQQVEIDDLLTC
ncbi:MAG: hypothetical protein O2967_10855 [Proteobacteria bacterium]|nr:hypothetical protein [Pseudomonadota bacterium]